MWQVRNAEGADAKTLRQKDRILTILWRAKGHRRSEIFQVDKDRGVFMSEVCSDMSTSLFYIF